MSQIESQTPVLTPAQLGYLSIADVAATLPIQGFFDDPELPIRRLIARGSLPAVQLGNAPNAPWRVALADLQAFIAAGCPAMQPPLMSNDWPSFPADVEWLAGGFVADVIEELGDQVPPDAKQFDFTTGQTPSMELTITPAIRALITAPAAKPTIPSDGAAPVPTPSPFKNMAEAYLVSRLRTFARWESSMVDPSRMGGSAALFKSPGMYKAITDQAAAQFKNGKIVFSQQFQVATVDTYGRKKQSWETVQFFVPDSAVMIAAGTTIARLTELAF